MNKIFKISLLLALFFPAKLAAQTESIDYAPSATYFFAQKDTCDLYMDVYDPAPDSELLFEGKAKPTILWLFGGGFVSGERSHPAYLPWFKLLNDNGYRVITADYRISLKGQQLGFSLFELLPSARKFVEACFEIGVQDCFSAVKYIIENSEALGVDPANIVLSGSSAGAMISVTAEWELVNRMPNAEVLPKDFNFAGIMSFSGAIMSDRGKPKWDREPCPQLLFHGTDDVIVNYKKTQFFKYGIFGSSELVELLKKQGYGYNIVRLEGYEHEIASSMMYLWQWEKNWLEQNVILGTGRVSDEWVIDPTIPKWGHMTLDTLY